MPDHASSRARRFCAPLSLLFMLVTTNGCVQRVMNVTSEPPGALVYWNDQEIGRTPFKRDFIWYGTYDVQVRKDGYETLQTRTTLVAPWWQWPPFDFFAEFWPGKFTDERWINYKLEPGSTEPPDAKVMLSHAVELKAQLESSQYTKFPATTRSSTQPSTTQSTTQSSTLPSTKP